MKETYFGILLNGRSRIYLNEHLYPGQTIFDSIELLIEKHAILMHSLNIYLLFIMSPHAHHNNVWDSMYAVSLKKRLFRPLKLFILEWLETRQTPNDTEICLKLQLLLMVIEQTESWIAQRCLD